MKKEEHNLLGIYINKQAATVVSLTSKHELIDCFEITAQEQEDEENQKKNPFAELAKLISEKITEKGLSFSRISVAADCSMYTQHNIQSEFTDYRQIASTVRFDTEGAIAADINNYALSFSKKELPDGSGSDLQVFTIKKEDISGIIKALQKEGMDPATVQPDVMLVSEFIREKINKNNEYNQTLFTAVSKKQAYFVSYDENGDELLTRTVLLGGSDDKVEQLSSQILLTIARISEQTEVSSVRVIGSDIDTSAVSEKTGLSVEGLSVNEFIEAQQAEKIEQCSDEAAFLTACGAAMTNPRKTGGLNFRNDYMPYQGRKRQIEKLARVLSIAAAGIMIILGVYLTFDLLQKQSLVKQLDQKFAEDYTTVMMGEQIPDDPDRAANELARELRRIRNVKSGQLSTTGEESVSAKLTILLSAFNKSAKATNVEIERINITSRSINIVGSTSSRASTLKLMEAMKDTRLEITKSRLETQDNRDRFSISLEV
jgi:hypothetical protein